MATNLGHLCLRRGEVEQAIEWFEEALKRNPVDAQAKEELENTRYVAGLLTEARECEKDLDWAGAEKLHREMTEVQPALQEGHVGLARALYFEKSYAEARDVLEGWLAGNEESAKAQDALAWVLVTAQDEDVCRPSEAVLHARRAVELDGERLEYVHTLVWALVRDGQAEEAQKVLDAARRTGTKGKRPTLDEVLKDAQDGSVKP